jgi:hypothetical protein
MNTRDKIVYRHKGSINNTSKVDSFKSGITKFAGKH